MRCAIWYHLYTLKNVENTHGGVLLACYLTKSNTPPWVFFTFFKLYKWYQIAQRITFSLIYHRMVLLMKTNIIMMRMNLMTMTMISKMRMKFLTVQMMMKMIKQVMKPLKRKLKIMLVLENLIPPVLMKR